ncbi:hypothetical protein [Rheinheimera sp. MMS21-TC3]|uniref:hypothetical protein n=1 Tax=Rheinheimera sp. MMS21-TC3 TaxID=3072790 RepID=UPI0028C45839|nr:hypothetical protein [Rheinheimera sp. MMS21-TC3]WNO60344.1 hypothetical protein RDV63_05105 [Rheinheimera sp. MMS21-TC3]
MKIDPKYIQELGKLVLRCKDVIAEHNWDLLAFVFDIADGHMANSGFIYIGDEVIPASARIQEDKMALSNKIREFQQAIFEACGHKFVQLLIQMNSAGKIHIDFEFDNPKRWNMGPANYHAMREQLRPVFV